MRWYDTPAFARKLLAMSQDVRIEFVLADGIELERALRWVGDHRHRSRGLGREQRRIGVAGERVKER